MLDITGEVVPIYMCRHCCVGPGGRERNVNTSNFFRLFILTHTHIYIHTVGIYIYIYVYIDRRLIGRIACLEKHRTFRVRTKNESVPTRSVSITATEMGSFALEFLQ